MSQDSSTENIIAIVGGGITGLYCAWRMLQDERYAGKAIHIYEATPECTGRIFTALKHQGFPIELGASRFTPHLHPVLWNLIHHFQLKLTPWNYANRYWFLRNKKLNLHHVADGNVPYNLSDEDKEKGILPNDMYDYVRTHHPSTPEELNTMTFKQYLNRHLSDEACLFFKESEGYEALYDDGLSALDGIRVVEEHPDMIPNGENPWYLLADGFQNLITILKKEVLEKGGQIFTKHKVVKVLKREGFVEVFLHHDSGDGMMKYSVDAERVIFTVMRDDLENIENNFDEDIREGIHATQPVSMVKIFTTYNTAWWNIFLQRDGNFCITDLPLCKIYFGPGAHLLFYSDSTIADFWYDIILQSSKEPHILQQHIQKYLSTLFRMDPQKLPEPTGIYSKYWSTGVHLWKPGINGEAVRTTLRGSVEGRVHIIGETYSRMSGWVEGSLVSVDDLLDRALSQQ